MILVLLGTQNNSFFRLLDEIENCINDGLIQEEVIVQSGHTLYNSDKMEILDFISELEKVQPDIFVVNTDGDSEKKRDYIESKGIQYIVLNREPETGLPARSTTTLRQQLKK